MEADLKEILAINAEARRIALADAIKAVKNERLLDEPNNEADTAYNIAINHAADAIKALMH